jgi:hypothetical protein
VSDPEIPDADDNFTPNAFGDAYLNKEVALIGRASDESDLQYGRVTKRLRDREGQPIGKVLSNS